ncbi:HlyD family secretion protein [Pseudoalteromonas tunicata]|uniref:Efflux transporter, RND family, MFP subunit n=1 Tax=Pseudoalteromonas tunicata D2 TaxID=87626 RepID=A4CDX2_9GAMM|nr:HlyD family efflux transporter periplasmic adaptor subunit [Pseudoalteromonas tunicata]ATC96343.1 hypothetical protein PTUN_a4127 [Pseudoalteromonas tunicata]AXT31843.1 HlyD family efflux transporter periplasmic adaptor subunit [Pseudoalteromonas tunicata]EAR27164.1 efflux transporter, RND family, MFP subunit [Pseudoalteromonas tunicata D2]
MQINLTPKHQKRSYWLFALALIAMATACIYFLTKQYTPKIARENLTIATVQQGDIALMAPVFGEFASRYERLISAPDNGKVTEILLRGGETVTENTPIAILTNPDLTQQYQQQKTQLNSTTAQFTAFTLRQQNELLAEEGKQEDLIADIESLMLDVEANRKLAELGIAAKIDLERSELKLAQLNKQLERNRFRLASFIKMQQLEKQQQHMRLVAEQQSVANLAAKMAALTIKAGIAGTLEKLDIELGQYVNAGQTLAKVGSSTDLIAKIRIPQRLAEKVQLDAKVNIKSKDSILSGKISQLSSVIRDGFVLAEVKILDPLPNYIRPALNLTADVFIEQKTDALFIKQAPGVQPLSKKTLYQLTDDSVAEQLEITFSERSGEYVLIGAGAKKDQQIITSDLSQWHNFAQLTVVTH